MLRIYIINSMTLKHMVHIPAPRIGISHRNHLDNEAEHGMDYPCHVLTNMSF